MILQIFFKLNTAENHFWFDILDYIIPKETGYSTTISFSYTYKNIGKFLDTFRVLFHLENYYESKGLKYLDEQKFLKRGFSTNGVCHYRAYEPNAIL